MRDLVEYVAEGGPARQTGLPADGNSLVTVTDAAGRVIATIDPFTRERKDLRGRVTTTHDKLAPRDAFVHMLLRPRGKPKATTAELPPIARKRGRPRKAPR